MATDPARLAGVLREAGLTTATTVRIRLRAYRPGQRAVVAVADGQKTWFVKVVRPAVAASLRARHDLIGALLPVPPVLAATSDGLLVLPRATGTPLRQVLATDGPAPPPAELDALLDALPPELTRFPRGGAALDRVHDFAAVLRHTVDPVSSVCDGLDDVVAELSDAPATTDPVVPVHGDFYEGQLFTAGGRVTGVLDVDTAGPGHRADEWATLLAHLLAAAMTARTPAVHRYAEAVLAHARRRVDPHDLRRRTSAALLGLATGPFRAQQPQWERHTQARIALARDWLRADERTLIEDFPASHLGVRF
ncbi:phosphotransferase family protein [Mycolicibacterium sp. XJ1819]